MASSLLSTAPYTYLFLAVVAIWIITDARLGLRTRDRGKPSQDRGSKQFIGVIVPAGIVGAVVAPAVLPAPQFWSIELVFWIGITLMLSGIGCRQYAAWTLREYFSIEVQVDAEQPVVTSGPYRYVRHPAYTGGFAILLGAGLALGNWLSLLVLGLAGTIGYGYRIRVEEQALRDTLGDAYEAYASQTPYRLVPLLW